MATFQETFQSGLEGLSGRNIGIDPGKTGRALTVIKPQRKLPMRDEQGKFVERNTGLLLTALNKIQSTLNTLVGLTQQSLNIEQKEQLDAKAAKTGAKIDAGETDLPPEIKKKTKKGPGIVGKIGKGMGSLWAGMGAKTAFAAVVAGLALLTEFSDELEKPLEKLLIWMRDDITPGLKKLWEDIQGWWTTGWESVKSFFGVMGEIFLGIQTYMGTFDIDEDKKGFLGLEPEEWDKMYESMIGKLATAVWDIFGNMITTLISAIGLYSVGSYALKALFSGKLASTALLTKFSLGKGVLGVAAYAAIVAAGIWKLADNAMTAWDDAITDEAGNKQKFDGTEFVSRLLGGKDYGSKWMGAVNNAWDKALLGGATGLVTGGGLGAIIGFLAGGIFGGITGYIGSDKLNVWISSVTDVMWDAMQAIGGWFGDIFRGLKSLVLEGDFMKGYKARDKRNVGALSATLDIEEAYLKELEDYQATMLKTDKAHMVEEGSWWYRERYQKQLAKVEKLRKEVKDAPLLSEQDVLAEKEKKINERRAIITGNIQTISETIWGYEDPAGQFKDIDMTSNIEYQQRRIDKLIEEDVQLQTDLEEIEVLRQEIENQLKSDAASSIPTGHQSARGSQMLAARKRAALLKAEAMDASDFTRSGAVEGPVIGAIQSNSNNLAKTDNVYAGGLAYRNYYPSAIILSHKGIPNYGSGVVV